MREHVADCVPCNTARQRRWPEKFPERHSATFSENQAWLYELCMPPVGSEDDNEIPNSDPEEDSFDGADQISDEGDGSITGDNASDTTDDSVNNHNRDPWTMNIETVIDVLLWAMEDDHLDRQYKMLEFCFGVSVGNLVASPGRGKKGTGSFALLDERSRTSTRPRKYKGPLTAQKLFEQLQTPRLRIDEGGEAPESSRAGELFEPNAERRLIYISDPEPLMLLALAATTSQTHVPALFDMIYYYRSRAATVHAKFRSACPVPFALHLEIPFFALREHDGLRKDKRARQDGTPWRHAQVVPFMVSNKSGLPYCLYESQTSIALTGIDDLLWTAFALVDAYYDDKRSSQYLHRKSRYPEMRYDPLGPGHVDINLPIWDPREYFLRVTDIQLEKATNEWDYLVKTFKDDVQKNTPGHLVARLSQGSTFVVSRKKVDEVHETVSQMVDMMNKLDDMLSKLITALDEFWRVDYPYFNDEEFSSRRHIPQVVEKIERSCSRLRVLSSDIAYTREVLKGLPTAIETHMRINSMAVSNFMFFVSILSVVFFPLVLSSSLFSIQPTVMPWTQNLESFLKVLIASAACVIIPIAIYLSWDWLWFTLTLPARMFQDELSSGHGSEKPSKGALDSSVRENGNGTAHQQGPTRQDEAPPGLTAAAGKQVARPGSPEPGGGARCKKSVIDLESGLAA